MATELGKAYVQIIPSAQGISGSIQKVLNPEASKAGLDAGNTIGTKLVGAIKGALTVAAIGKVITKTITEGAALEQSLGGIETLFKNNADKMKAYASEAYKTVGISANEYMENVTSFSASLLQSLGGNTAKAADVANMAMIDMGDNANKMGTSMESIQDAYQGFAKQNYTMLDNLKLGYGGTKTEMERLLKDATKLSGVKYDIGNLSDVYSAIHVIQEELRITGTTALEASETFSGSLSAMKAAVSDFLGNLAIGEDIKPSLAALAETVSTFVFGNLIPMLGNIITALPGAIVTFIEGAVPQLLKALTDMINNLASWISAEKPAMKESAVILITEFISSIGSKIPDLLIAVGNLVIAMVKAMFDNRAKIGGAGGELIKTLLSALLKAMPDLLEAGGEFVIEIGKGIKNKASEMYEEAKESLKGLMEEISQWDDKFYEAGANIVGSIADGIRSAVKKVTDAIGDVVGDVRDFLPFSPAKRGPLRDLNKLDFSIIANGINKAENPITTAMNDLAQSAIDSFNPYGGLQTSIAVNRSMVDTSEQSKQMIDKMGDSRTAELLEALIDIVQSLGLDIKRLPDRQQALARE